MITEVKFGSTIEKIESLGVFLIFRSKFGGFFEIFPFNLGAIVRLLISPQYCTYLGLIVLIYHTQARDFAPYMFDLRVVVFLPSYRLNA